MKFLVLGCNGMAGHVISLYLHEQEHDVTGIDLKESLLVKSIAMDVTDFPTLKRLIQQGEYDVLINCIGILNQFAENNHALAVLLNSYLPHFLADVTKDLPTRVMHMSTDCVFSGKRGTYTENDFPDGELFYDRSKAMGELIDEKNLTLRTSIVGPDINEGGIGLLNWFLHQSEAVNGFTGAIWTGQTTLQLAKTMEQAALAGATGLFNAVPAESTNKYELLCLFNRYIRREPIEVVPIERFIADKSLVRTNFEGFDFRIPTYEVMIRELGDWMRAHKSMYPHYDL